MRNGRKWYVGLLYYATLWILGIAIGYGIIYLVLVVWLKH